MSSFFHPLIRFSQTELQSEILQQIEALSLCHWNTHAVFQHYQVPVARSQDMIQALEAVVGHVLSEIKTSPEQTESQVISSVMDLVASWDFDVHFSRMDIIAVLRQIWRAYPWYTASRTYSACVQALTGYMSQKPTSEGKSGEPHHPRKVAAPSVKSSTRRRKSTKST
jgi:hypothetical protein